MEKDLNRTRKYAEIRLRNARSLADALGTRAVLAELLGKSAGQMSALLKANPLRAIGDNLANQIEQQLDLDNDSLDREDFDALAAVEKLKGNQKLAKKITERTSRKAKLLDANKITDQLDLLQRLQNILKELPIGKAELLAKNIEVSSEELESFLKSKLISFSSLKRVLEHQGASHLIKGNFMMLPREWKSEFSGAFFNPYAEWLDPDKDLLTLEDSFSSLAD